MQIPTPLDAVEHLKAQMPDAVDDVHIFRDETTIIILPENVPAVLRFLRDTPGLVYNYLSDISAVDYYPDYSRPARFGVSYHLYALLYSRRLRVKTFVDEDESIPTVTSIWPGANWLEREIIDMMGIPFADHPDPRRVLMPKDWDGHPHRRDYPLGYETVQFSFNIEEIMKHKPFAKE
ncbi:MAG: NADH-quinone oxidoreductase subunit C [Anaerolineaceae bacterium]|nr:MAG: NADH-quinone oxidoreductase subunit C [Anaerolineaceae bacterium]